ncbi:hypothetical protein ACOME3_003682 [Neoechinorhynchus agilis]
MSFEEDNLRLLCRDHQSGDCPKDLEHCANCSKVGLQSLLKTRQWKRIGGHLLQPLRLSVRKLSKHENTTNGVLKDKLSYSKPRTTPRETLQSPDQFYLISLSRINIPGQLKTRRIEKRSPDLYETDTSTGVTVNIDVNDNESYVRQIIDEQQQICAEGLVYMIKRRRAIL